MQRASSGSRPPQVGACTPRSATAPLARALIKSKCFYGLCANGRHTAAHPQAILEAPTGEPLCLAKHSTGSNSLIGTLFSVPGFQSCRQASQSQSARHSDWLGFSPAATRTAAVSRGRHRLSNTRLQALSDATLGLTEPSKHPWAACKRWLQDTFPLLRNEELIARAAWTVMIIAIARMGLHLRLPFVNRPVRPTSDNPGAMEDWLLGLKGLPDNIFNLGIGPVINASILISVCLTLSSAGFVGPYWQAKADRMKEEGAEGYAQIQWYTNYCATGTALVTGVWEAFRMASSAQTEGIPFIFLTSVILTAGTCTLRWLSDSVENSGLGDGITVLIALNIVSSYTTVLDKAAATVILGKMASSQLAMLVLAYMGLVFLAVVINTITLRLPLVYYKQRRSKAPQESLDKRKAASEALGTSQLAIDNAYLPLSLSPNGMSAILYASFIYQLPILVGLVSTPMQKAMQQFLMHGRFANLVYGVVVFFCGVVQFGQNTPQSMTKFLTAIEAGVEGISPGPSTEKYLRRTMNIMRFWGALSVAVLASAAHMFDMQCLRMLGTSMSSVSLLLVVGLITSVIRQVQSLLQIPALERAMKRERDVLQRISSSNAAGA